MAEPTSDPFNAKELVATLTDVLHHANSGKDTDLLKSAVPTIVETGYDGWNGGTSLHRLTLEVPSLIYADIEPELQATEDRFLNRLKAITRDVDGALLTEVLIRPRIGLSAYASGLNSDTEDLWSSLTSFRLFISHVSLIKEKTLFIYMNGRDKAPMLVPLQLADSLCRNGCALGGTVTMEIKDKEVTVFGIPVGKTVVLSHRQDALPSGVKINRLEFGNSWPLTVESGYLDCIDGKALVFRTGRKSYAINGIAESYGYVKIDPIWRANPEIKSFKMDIGLLLNRAKGLCSIIGP